MRKLAHFARRLTGDVRGATVVEYGFIIALVVLAIIASVSTLADTTTAMWNNVSEQVLDTAS
jgi:pilus assembly protein Flp/PilA